MTLRQPSISERAKGWLKASGERGFQSAEIYYENRETLMVRVRQGEIEQYTVSEVQGMALRATIQGKTGSAYTERLDEEAISEWLDAVEQNAALQEDRASVLMYDGSLEANTLPSSKAAPSTPSTEELVNWVKKLETYALGLHPAVSRVQNCQIGIVQDTRALIHSTGLHKEDTNGFMYAALGVIAGEGDDVKTAYATKRLTELNDEALIEIAQKAVHEASSLLGAKSLPSGRYPAVLSHKVAATLLGVYQTVFSAEQVNRGLSYYGDREGQVIANPIIQLLEDPVHPDAPFSTVFDAEGVPTTRKAIIENGTLKQFMSHLKSAAKAQRSSTGNAGRASYKGEVDVAPTNLYVQNGPSTLEELFAQMKDGLYITDIQGVHSGTNKVSGDLSLAAHGFWVEGGVIARPVHQITISGNYYELLQEVEALANNMEFTLPTAQRSSYASPAWLLPSIAVAGE